MQEGTVTSTVVENNEEKVEEHDKEPEKHKEPELAKEPERKTLFGVEVSDIGTDYPTSNSKPVVILRKAVKDLEDSLYRSGDDTTEVFIKNLAAALNRIEVRVNNRVVHNKQKR